MTSRPSLHDLQDDALLQAALRRYSAQQPPARSAWTYRLAVLGFVLGGAAFVMEAVSLSGGVGLSVAEPAAARSMWLNSSYSNRFRSIWQNSTLGSLSIDQPAATTPNASAPPEPASPTAPEARSQASPSDDSAATPPKPTLAADATAEGMPQSAGAGGATFQALDRQIDGWVSRATRLTRQTVPRCWAPHTNPDTNRSISRRCGRTPSSRPPTGVRRIRARRRAARV
jgi:hypothetical protein